MVTLKRRRARQRRVGELPAPTHRPKRVAGRVVGRPSSQQHHYAQLRNEIADLKSKMKRNSIINWTLIGIEWIMKLVFLFV
jgi:hypothetical protein